LQTAGLNTDEFNRVFATPINTAANVETDALQFWYFASDILLFTTNNQVELGSGGKADLNEYSWNIGTLVNGWNLITLPLKNATKTGTPDVGAINWFRVYHFKTGNVTTKIDQIRIIENPAPNAISELIQNNIRIYPNPLSKNTLSLTIVGNLTLENAQVLITNLQGQTVYRNRIQNSKSIEINTASFVGGTVYIIAIKSSDFNYKQKIIVN
jgi:hypothetical protein